MPGFNIAKAGSNSNGPSATAESARAHRFSVRTSTTVLPDDLARHIKTCERPKFETESVVIHHGAFETYRPGKSRWQPISMTFL